MKTARIFASLVVAAVVGAAGFAIGRLTAPGVPPSKAEGASASPPKTRPTIHNVKRRIAPEGAPCDERLVDAESEIQALREALDEMELEIYGAPVTWPADTPAVFQPENFEKIVRRVLDECKVDVGAVRFECSEPPCYMVGRRAEEGFSSDDPWFEDLMGCPLWNESFPGGSLMMATDKVSCPDGSTEGFLMLAPGPDWLKAGLDEEGESNLSKRFEARTATAKESWVCRPGQK